MSGLTGLVVGLGSIGRRHLANLRALEPGARIVAVRQQARRGETAGPPPQADAEVFGLDEALAERPAFAIVCNPAPAHVETARVLAEANVHLLVEKPLSDRLDGVDTLIGTCRDRNVTLMVGYTLRYNAQLRQVREALAAGRIGRLLSIRAEVGQYLPDWRPGTDYRKGTTARAALGGGVLLELSHEIDYVRWLGGEVRDVSARVARLGDLEIDVDDCAEIVMTLEGGAMASVHLDLLQRPAVRSARIVGTGGTIVWDGIAGTASVHSSATAAWEPLGEAAAGRNDMYLAELRDFLSCVAGARPSPISGEEGRRVLQIALAAKASSAEGRTVTL